MPNVDYAYLHGFASSSLSKKALLLSGRFQAEGYELHRPDLNNPSFSLLTVTGALERLDAMDKLHGDPSRRWRLLGSSMGGYLAALWASLRPERVDRLLLLCPGFDLLARWPGLFGEKIFQAWETSGWLTLPDATGTATPVHWGFVEDYRRYPAFPSPSCPMLLLHGRQDAVVPLATSQRFVKDHPQARLIEVEDEHPLMRSLPILDEAITTFFFASPEAP